MIHKHKTIQADLKAENDFADVLQKSAAGPIVPEDITLRGGFRLAGVRLTAQPLLDPIERAAVAQTLIRGSDFQILLRADLNEKELSISLYHEVLEAATVAREAIPPAVLDYNQGDFEKAAQSAHQRLGMASPTTLSRFLAGFGF